MFVHLNSLLSYHIMLLKIEIKCFVTLLYYKNYCVIVKTIVTENKKNVNLSQIENQTL